MNDVFVMEDGTSYYNYAHESKLFLYMYYFLLLFLFFIVPPLESTESESELGNSKPDRSGWLGSCGPGAFLAL